MLMNLNNLMLKLSKIILKHAKSQDFSSFFNNKVIIEIKQKLPCSLVSAAPAYPMYMIKLSVIFSCFKYFIILVITA